MRNHILTLEAFHSFQSSNLMCKGGGVGGVDSGKLADFESVLMEQGLGEDGRQDEMKYDQLH